MQGGKRSFLKNKVYKVREVIADGGCDQVAVKNVVSRKLYLRIIQHMIRPDNGSSLSRCGRKA